jgi:hypothetical protein
MDFCASQVAHINSFNAGATLRSKRRTWIGIACALLLCACGGPDQLGGGYSYTYGGRGHAWISKDKRVLVDDYVVGYKSIQGYVVVRRKISRSVDCYDQHGVPTIITHYTDNDEFWIINVTAGVELGPLDEVQYGSTLRNLEMPYVSIPVPSHFHPDTQSFAEFTQRCARVAANSNNFHA